jgi:hypothetical protein
MLSARWPINENICCLVGTIRLNTQLYIRVSTIKSVPLYQFYIKQSVQFRAAYRELRNIKDLMCNFRRYDLDKGGKTFLRNVFIPTHPKNIYFFNFPSPQHFQFVSILRTITSPLTLLPFPMVWYFTIADLICCGCLTTWMNREFPKCRELKF